MDLILLLRTVQVISANATARGLLILTAGEGAVG